MISTAQGTRSGTHDTVGVVLENLTGHINDDVRLHLQWILNHDSGPNLRNQIAHGDVARADNAMAVVAIYTLLVAMFGLAPGFKA